MQNPNVIVASTFGPMIVNVNDAYIGAGILQHGHWGYHDIQLFAELLRRRGGGARRMTYYDVGANIGSHTLGVASLLRGQVSVRAFEAQRNVYYMLCGTVAINNLRDVECHHAAVSDRAGDRLTFHSPDYGTHNNLGGLELMPPVNSDNDTMVHAAQESVLTVTIDSFNEPVDFIKIDIEGMEDRALRGAVAAVDAFRPIVFAETGKTDRDFVFDFFRQRSYAAFAADNDALFLPREMNVTPANMQALF